jgi:Pex19 protein family.
MVVYSSNNSNNKIDILDPELEKEYQKFMDDLAKGAGQGQDPMNQFAKLFGDLLTGINEAGNAEEGKENTGDNKAENGIKNLLDAMMKNVDNNDFDSVAQTLLKEFMDKDILEEPLKEARKNYENYFKENEGKIKPEELAQYDAQYKCILELIETIEKEPENKEKMIQIFEKMHEHGLPPEGILSPLSKVGPGMTPDDGNAGLPNMGDLNQCNIF